MGWEISSKKESIVRSFRKCGISLPIDGSEDGEINISGVENYEVGSADTDTSDSESEGVATDQDEDPFANL